MMPGSPGSCSEALGRWGDPPLSVQSTQRPPAAKRDTQGARGSCTGALARVMYRSATAGICIGLFSWRPAAISRLCCRRMTTRQFQCSRSQRPARTTRGLPLLVTA